MAQSGKGYLAYWGKARPLAEWQQTWHPAAYHCLDVAAIANGLLSDKPEALLRFASRVGIPWDNFQLAITLLAAIHDLAKVTDAFQLPYPKEYTGAGTPSRLTGRCHHGDLLYALFKEGRGAVDPTTWGVFQGWEKDRALSLLQPICGHHGFPPQINVGGRGARKGLDADDLRSDDRYVSPGVRADLVAFLDDLQALLPTQPLKRLGAQEVASLSWILSGFIVQCDWMGSSREWFPYHAPSLDIGTYWHDVATPRAQRAILEGRVTPTAVIERTGLQIIYPKITQARPLQVAAGEIPLPGGQCIVMAEDVTGAGKTEAAMLLAHRMIRAGLGDGIFIGLPTMATSDALYSRTTLLAQNLYPEGASPQIVLSHGGGTKERRKALDLRKTLGSEAREVEGEGEVGDEIEGWAAADRNSALLADLGVGTIDQALLAALPAKYQGMRLYGLAGKILVVDEAHSYDPYMREELCGLLRFQGFLGGSCILLSATLPLGVRQKLLDAFAEGAGWHARAKGPTAAAPRKKFVDRQYPALHVHGAGGVQSIQVDACKDLTRTVRVEMLGKVESAYERIESVVQAGGCVCLIRSTVDAAIASAGALMDRGYNPTLLHARMIPPHRATVEADVRARFGKNGTRQDRAGGIVVATQVIEQSLDVDFDILLTDLAPVELLIQRAGRVWRHMEERPVTTRPFPGPALCLIGPDPDEVSDAGWLKDALPGAAAVYHDHGAVWSAAYELKKAGGFQVPEDIRDLIERCAAGGDVPAALQRVSDRASGKAAAEGGVGRLAVLNPREGYCSSDPWDDDAKVSTRIGTERHAIRLAAVHRGSIIPFSLSGPQADWRNSELQVSRTRLREAVNDPASAATITGIQAAWPRFEREIPVVVLTPNEQGVMTGRILDGKGNPGTMAYDPVRGLVWGNAHR